MGPKRLTLTVLLGGTMLAAAGMPDSAPAQDIAAAGEERGEAGERENTETRLGQIVVSGEAPQRGIAVNVPAGESVIGQDTIRTFGNDKLDSVLRSTPGTFTRENAQQPGVAVNIRGFEGSGRVTSTVDGVRQNFRFTGHEASGFTYVDPAFLRAVEVRRGAVSAAGGGGLAGSVGYRTIGVDDVLSEGQDRGMIARMQWGSNGAGPSEMIAGAFRSGGAGFVIGLSGRSSDDYRNGNGQRETSTGQELRSGLFKGEFEFGNGHRLSFGGLIYRNEFGANSYNQRVDNRTFTAGYRYDPADNGAVDLSANLYYNDLSMEYLSPIDPGSPFASAVGRRIRDRGIGFDVSNVSTGMLGAVDVRSENGIEYFRDKVTAENSGVNPAAGRAATRAIFTENTFTYGRLDVIAALRYDHYSLDGAADAGGAFGAYRVDQSKGRLNPRLTVAWQATDWLQPYITWSQSMRAPTIQETMTGGDHPGGTSAAFLPNPELRPERQKGWELGANIQRDNLFMAGDSLSAKIGFFSMDVTDYVAARVNPDFGRMQYVNLPGTSRQQGIEIGAGYDTGSFYMDLAYTHTDSKLPPQQPGLGALNDLPDDIATLPAGTRLMDRRLHLGGRIHYVSNDVAASGDMPPVLERTSGYTLVDAFASFEFRKNAEIGLRITNLFDRAYTPALSTFGSGQGRTAYLTANFRF